MRIRTQLPPWSGDDVANYIERVQYATNVPLAAAASSATRRRDLFMALHRELGWCAGSERAAAEGCRWFDGQWPRRSAPSGWEESLFMDGSFRLETMEHIGVDVRGAGGSCACPHNGSPF
jgi:hypothetical protein